MGNFELQSVPRCALFLSSQADHSQRAEFTLKVFYPVSKLTVRKEREQVDI